MKKMKTKGRKIIRVYLNITVIENKSPEKKDLKGDS